MFDIVTRKALFWTPAVHIRHLNAELFRPWLLRGVASAELPDAYKAQLLDQARTVKMTPDVVGKAIMDGVIPLWVEVVTNRENLKPVVVKYDHQAGLVWFIFSANVPPALLEAWLSAFHWGIANSEKAVEIYEAAVEYGIHRMNQQPDSPPLSAETLENVARMKQANFGYPLGDIASSPTIEREEDQRRVVMPGIGSLKN